MEVNLLIFVIILCVFCVQSNIYETHQHIERAGYVAETHHVTTEDGYILGMHRIPFRRNETSGLTDRPVVFLLHGLLGSSIGFIKLGRHYAMAYNLADAGFDVWIGNARGNRNSRRHVSLDPDANPLQFFDFTWNEIGMYDVPTMIDYILEHTENKRLHYIGHSQGGTAFLVMASTRPDYNEKIATAHLLAGSGSFEDFPNAVLRNLAMFTNVLWPLVVNIGFIEVFPPSPIFPLSDDSNEDLNLWEYCVGDPKFKDICILTGVKEIMESSKWKQQAIDDTVIETLGYDGGASFKQIAHYGQNIKDESFRKWDFGIRDNIAKYGSAQPPVYNLSLITADVTLHYAVSDVLVGVEDVYVTAINMPRTRIRRVPNDTFKHSDFINSNEVRELVTLYIIDKINEYNGTTVTELPETTDPDEGQPDSSSSIVLSVVMKIYLIVYFTCLR